MDINRIANKYENFKRTLNKHTSVQITDNCELLIDNCLGVKEYDENLIILFIPSKEFVVTGTRLSMSHYGTDGVIIKGKINSVTFAQSK